jgi:hypothetical protein
MFVMVHMHWKVVLKGLKPFFSITVQYGQIIIIPFKPLIEAEKEDWYILKLTCMPVIQCKKAKNTCIFVTFSCITTRSLRDATK